MAQVAAFLGPLCALGSSITWALAASVYTQAAGRVGAIRTNFLRALIVVPLFLVSTLLVCGPRAFVMIPPAQVGWLALSMLCSYSLGDLVFYLSALRIGTPPALAIASIYPLWAAISGALTLGEALSLERIVGTLFCIAGVVWLVLQQRTAREMPTDQEEKGLPGRVLVGVGLALLTSVFWAGNTYAIRQGGVGQPFLLVNTLRYFMSVGTLGIGLVLHQAATKPRKGLASKDQDASVLPLRFFVIVIVEAFFGSSIFVYALSHTALSVAAPLSSLAPLFAVPIGLLLGTESLNARRLSAIVLTVLGVVLLMR